MSRFLAISKYRSVGEVKESAIRTAIHINPKSVLFLMTLKLPNINAQGAEKISKYNRG
jgi:hypothetical protein